jgi:hypothetical protein
MQDVPSAGPGVWPGANTRPVGCGEAFSCYLAHMHHRCRGTRQGSDFLGRIKPVLLVWTAPSGIKRARMRSL